MPAEKKIDTDKEAPLVPGALESLRARLAGLTPAALQLVRFALVGGLGTATNLVLFYVLVDVGGMGPLRGAVVCFAVAVSQNYVLNELWTFATASESDARLSWGRYSKFVLASSVGLAVNGAVLAALIAAFEFPLLVIPQAIGILAGMTVNFIASRRIVFRRS